jgi:hypothetical protein
MMRDGMPVEGDKIGGARDMGGTVKVLRDEYGAGMEGGMEMRAISTRFACVPWLRPA